MKGRLKEERELKRKKKKIFFFLLLAISIIEFRLLNKLGRWKFISYLRL
jgi:hypothetical protein